MARLRSTSPIMIDGDRPLGHLAKLAYLGANAVRNRALGRSGGLSLERFGGADQATIAGTPSPSRLLCERHLASIEWAKFSQSAGGIRMHDMGCGSGRAGRLVAAAAGSSIRYRGFDVRKDPAWEASRAGSEMTVFDGVDFAGTIRPGDNLFFSQSAAEHIPSDLEYFSAVARACDTASGPTLQMHYLPAASCLRLYLFHGFRQYPIGALARLAALQASDAKCAAVALGGPAAIELHWRWITRPLLSRQPDQREVDPVGYRAALSAAIESDVRATPSAALFWAFIVRRRF
ncbi:MAG: hypothetical protein GC202_11835 [Alphaproteobacteria bacterium]|nr:hypothetical protein [Alphaproteobacteria bacterium]